MRVEPSECLKYLCCYTKIPHINQNTLSNSYNSQSHSLQIVQQPKPVPKVQELEVNQQKTITPKALFFLVPTIYFHTTDLFAFQLNKSFPRLLTSSHSRVELVHFLTICRQTKICNLHPILVAHLVAVFLLQWS